MKFENYKIRNSNEKNNYDLVCGICNEKEL